ncbi:ArdC family protein [Caulobacter sp. DWR1-3-2b1]|uniref:ArdC family protein n=1 Tax=Caulobacter sp. DWR1-3-2b1 TaxID=2804670 RepID=UPI003CF866FC
MSNPLEPLLNEIITRLERGVPPWRQPWANGADPSTPLQSEGQPFSGSNAWLLAFAAGRRSPARLQPAGAGQAAPGRVGAPSRSQMLRGLAGSAPRPARWESPRKGWELASEPGFGPALAA